MPLRALADDPTSLRCFVPYSGCSEKRVMDHVEFVQLRATGEGHCQLRRPQLIVGRLERSASGEASVWALLPSEVCNGLDLEAADVSGLQGPRRWARGLGPAASAADHDVTA